MASPYSELIPPIISEVQNAFNSLSGRQGDFLADDVLPGDRYAVLEFESLDYDNSRDSQLQDGRMKLSPFVMRHLIISRTAIDVTGLSDLEAQQAGAIASAIEAIELHHLVGKMHEVISNPYKIIERLSIRLPIDRAVSQRIMDASTLVLTTTAEFNIHIWLKQDIYGAHVYE